MHFSGTHLLWLTLDLKRLGLASNGTQTLCMSMTLHCKLSSHFLGLESNFCYFMCSAGLHTVLVHFRPLCQMWKGTLGIWRRWEGRWQIVDMWGVGDESDLMPINTPPTLSSGTLLYLWTTTCKAVSIHQKKKIDLKCESLTSFGAAQGCSIFDLRAPKSLSVATRTYFIPW